MVMFEPLVPDSQSTLYTHSIFHPIPSSYIPSVIISSIVSQHTLIDLRVHICFLHILLLVLPQLSNIENLLPFYVLSSLLYITFFSETFITYSSEKRQSQELLLIERKKVKAVLKGLHSPSVRHSNKKYWTLQLKKVTFHEKL